MFYREEKFFYVARENQRQDNNVDDYKNQPVDTPDQTEDNYAVGKKPRTKSLGSQKMSQVCIERDICPAQDPRPDKPGHEEEVGGTPRG